MTLEAQTLARACGKSHVHNLEPEDLVALTVEAAAMAEVPLAGNELDSGQERQLAASNGDGAWRRTWRGSRRIRASATS